MVLRAVGILVLAFLVLFIAPLAARAALYWWRPTATDWWSAPRTSSGLLRPADQNPDAAIRIFAAPTVSWRGIFAVHSWIVLKAPGAGYERYDKVGWGGAAIRQNGYVPDGLWFGSIPEVVWAADGVEAERLLPAFRAAIAAEQAREPEYRAWPGPNSNTFVASVMAAVPGLAATLPPNALGKDYPVDGSWLGWTPSRTGVRLNLGGYFGVTGGWVEGLEINVLGAVAGLDWRRPALKVPGFGRIGV